MKNRTVMNILAFIPFTFGLLLCKTERGGFYGNNSGLIGIPLCIASELGMIIFRYYLLVRQLSSEDIAEQKRSSVMTGAVLGNIVLCFFSVLFFISLSADKLGTSVICCCIIIGYDIPLAVKRKDLIISIICLSIIMMILCCFLCSKIDVISFYSSIYR